MGARGRDAGNLITLAYGINRVYGVRGLKDDHEIDLVLEDQFGGHIARLGGVTLRVHHLDPNRQFLPRLLDENPAILVDLGKHAVIDPRS